MTTATETKPQTPTNAPVVALTDRAIRHVRRLLDNENKPELGLRLGIQGGGCSGLSYKLGFDMATPADHVHDFGGVRVYVDPKSALYLKGTQLDFDDSLNGKGFQFKNPNAENTCGCGESFSI